MQVRPINFLPEKKAISCQARICAAHHRLSGAPLAGISQKRAGAATGPEGHGTEGGAKNAPMQAAYKQLLPSFILARTLCRKIWAKTHRNGCRLPRSCFPPYDILVNGSSTYKRGSPCPIPYLPTTNGLTAFQTDTTERPPDDADFTSLAPPTPFPAWFHAPESPILP